MGRATSSLIFLVIFIFHQIYAGRVPVILIPGNGGNQLEAKIDRPPGWEGDCPKKKDWHRIWLDVWQLLPTNLPCWTKEIELEYDPKTGRSSPPPGVSTRVLGWGQTKTVEYIDPSWSAWVLGNAGAYMLPLLKAMRRWGYRDGIDVRGAPYDWRLIPKSQGLFGRLAALVEETYKINGNRKVALIAHSLGCRWAHLFLKNQKQEWKDRYIHSVNTLSAPWGGSVEVMRLFASGFNMGINGVDPKIIRHEQRTSEGNVFLLPTNTAFKENDALLITSQRNYTIKDYHAFFTDVTYSIGERRLAAMEADRHDMRHPGVPVNCLFGQGVKTVRRLRYREGQFPLEQPDVEYGSGDGTVNHESLSVCQGWSKNVTDVASFAGVTHNGMFKSPAVQEYLRKVLTTTN